MHKLFLAVSGFVCPLVAVSFPKFGCSSVLIYRRGRREFINCRVFQTPVSIHFFDFGKSKTSLSPVYSDLRVEVFLMKVTSHKLLNFENYTLHTIKFISTTGAQKSKNLGFEHFLCEMKEWRILLLGV